MDNMIKELEYYEKREFERLNKIFKDGNILKYLKDLGFWPLIKSYYKDMVYFHEKGDKFKSLELANYLWGYLDCLVNIGIINEKDIKEEYKKWFKIY